MKHNRSGFKEQYTPLSSEWSSKHVVIQSVTMLEGYKKGRTDEVMYTTQN